MVLNNTEMNVIPFAVPLHEMKEQKKSDLVIQFMSDYFCEIDTYTKHSG